MTKPAPMVFWIVELQEGGADGWAVSRDEVTEYLSRSPYWAEDHDAFTSIDWRPGMALSWSSGWIFCLINHEAMVAP